MAPYQLDSAHYLTMPGFAWGDMLKNANDELLENFEMVLFDEKGKLCSIFKDLLT